MDTLSIPQVAQRLKVSRNTPLYWIKMGYMKATVRNGLVSRPQYRVSLEEVKRIEKALNVTPKR